MYRLKKLTRARVEQWLREHQAKYFLGSSAQSCPIAAYIQDVHTAKHTVEVPLVSSRMIRLYRHHAWEAIETPHWVVKFIKKVDTNYAVGDKLSGREALAILQGI